MESRLEFGVLDQRVGAVMEKQWDDGMVAVLGRDHEWGETAAFGVVREVDVGCGAGLEEEVNYVAVAPG
jgi:hypothetical protein